VDLPKLSAPYVVIGAVATSLYMPRRETQDLSILIHARDREQIATDLREAGFALQGQLSIGGTS
jgi:hypothetical protein